MKRSTVSLFFLLLLIGQAQAQLRPYALYHLSPTLTNPALVATSDYSQVTAHYRQSKVSGYQVPSLSYVHPFYGKASGNRYGGMGFTLISQSSGLYRVTGALGGLGYDFNLSERHHLASGLQVGLLNKRLDLSRVTTESQYGGNGYDAALATGEHLDPTSRSAVAVNAGINWYYTDATGNQKASLGVASYNVNRPGYRFVQERNQEPVSYLVTGSFLLARKGNFSVLPAFRYIRQRNMSLANIGSLFSYALAAGGENKLGAGFWGNTNGSISLGLQLEKEHFVFAFAYDASTYPGSQIAPVNNAFEAALSWRVNRQKKVSGRKATSEPAAPEPPAEVKSSPREEKPVAEVPGSVAAAPQPEAAREDEKVGKDTARLADAQEKELLTRKIAYPLGGTELSPEDEQFLDSLARELKQNPGWRLQISGHTCSTGSREANQRVSLQRARYVQQRLVQKGVPQSQLLALGQANQYPVASNDTEAGRARNRRVEFVLLK